MRARAVAASILVLGLIASAPALAADPQATLADIEDEVMCVQCGTPLSLSTSGVANRERDYISAEIARGRTKEEILDGLVARFGPSVLALPERKGFNLVAYLVPALAVLLALIAILLAARRWRRTGDVPDAPAAAPLADGESRRIDRELSELGRTDCPVGFRGRRSAPRTRQSRRSRPRRAGRRTPASRRARCSPFRRSRRR